MAGLGSPAFCGWRRRSGTSEQGNGKIAKGLARRGSCSAVARERRRAGVLYRAGHGGGEVAAGGWICGAWHGMEGTMRRAIAVRSFSATRGRSAQAGGGLRPALSGAAPVDRGSKRLKKGGSICKFRIFQGPYCKLTITFKLGLK